MFDFVMENMNHYFITELDDAIAECKKAMDEYLSEFIESKNPLFAEYYVYRNLVLAELQDYKEFYLAHGDNRKQLMEKNYQLQQEKKSRLKKETRDQARRDIARHTITRAHTHALATICDAISTAEEKTQ